MRIFRRFALFVAAFCLITGAGRVTAAEKATGAKAKRGAESVWTIGFYAGATPFDLEPAAGATQPVFTGPDTGDPDLDIVAHPFWVGEGGRLHLFFTLKSTKAGTGVIGLAESADGIAWKYRGVAVREASVLSYPCVFKFEGRYYMVPESSDNVMRLYRATEFPLKWEREAELMKGEKLVSPTVLRHGGGWWLFAAVGTATLRLFQADDLHGPWTEHPRSPLVANDANIARPAGRPLLVNGRLYRLAQDCEPTYGNRVLAFEITALSKTEYREQAVEKSLVAASGTGWNAAAMHHVDAQVVGNRWLAVVDARGVPVKRPGR